VLTQAQQNGGLDTFTVTVPRALDIPEIQRAARNAYGFKFSARLASAVSTCRIDGTLTV
jgi:hypothetical protein